ncbi:DEAD/DEAH box helicase, partial [bacterium]|nr:DEAD/DEAH box helicase [bacterium]
MALETATRISITTQFVVTSKRQLMLAVDAVFDNAPISLGLSSLMQFLYENEQKLTPGETEVFYLLTKLIKKAQIGTELRYVIPSENDMGLFFGAILEHKIPVLWQAKDGPTKPLSINGTLPITVMIEDQKNKLVCTMINRNEWMDTPWAWMRFTVNRKPLIFSNGVIRSNISNDMEQFIRRFLDYPKVFMSGVDADRFVQNVYRHNKEVIFWQVRTDLSRFVPHEVHPEPVLKIDYANGRLDVEIRYRYEKEEISPQHPSDTIPSTRGPIKRMMDLEGIYQADLIDLFTQHDVPLALSNPGDIARFFDIIVPLLEDRGWYVRSNAPEFKVDPNAIDLQFSIGGSTTDWFYFEPSCTIQGQAFSLQEIARLMVDNQGYVQTKTGFVRLSDQSQSELKVLSESGALRVGKKFNIAEIMPLIAATNSTGSTQDSSSVVDRLKKLHSVGYTEPGPGFVGKLRDYQQYGVNWMYFLAQAGLGGVLADDMGLGKTVQTIAFSTRIESKKPVLIVGPTNVIYNWKHELAQFVPDRSVLVYTGSNREKLIREIPKHNYVITSYGVLKNDIDILKQIPFSAVIADEAQALKNPLTQISKSIKLLNSEYRLALSGTPIENHLMDLWNLFDFTIPGFLGTKKEFDIAIKDEATDRIRLRIKPFVLRREKREVLASLPEKTEILIKCPLSDAQTQLYKTILDAVKKGIRDINGNAKKLHVLTSLLKLRQVCTHPQLISEMAHLPIDSAKFDIATEKILELVDEGHKIVVFSQFTQMLDIFQKWTAEEKIYTERIDGSVTGKNRQSAVERFQTSEDPGVFLISLKAGGVGINLTAADYVIHIDPWWNPAIESQATDRVHRMGQTNKVFVYKLIAEGTIEEKIAELQAQKRELLAS